MQLGDYSRAVQDFKLALQSPSAHRHKLHYLHYDLALALMYVGRLDEARHEIVHAIKRDPTNKMLWVARGIIHRRMDRYKDARDDYTTLRHLARKTGHDDYSREVLVRLFGMLMALRLTMSLLQQSVQLARLEAAAESGTAKAAEEERAKRRKVLDPFEEALRTPPGRRTDLQLELLARECKLYAKWFSRFPKDVLTHLWSKLKLLQFEPGQRIISIGFALARARACARPHARRRAPHPDSSRPHIRSSKPDAFYIAITGELSVRVSRDSVSTGGARAFAARLEGNEMEVATLTAGDTFGELAIMRRQKREASIVAKTKARVLALPAEEYRNTVQLLEDRQLAAKVEFLREALLFESWSEEQLAHVASIAQTRHYERGAAVVTQDEEAQKLYFVRKGVVNVLRGVTEQEPPFSVVNTRVCALTSGDFFGEQSVLDPMSGRYPATFVCDTYVELLEINKRQIDSGWITGRVRQWIKELAVRYPEDAKVLQMALDKQIWDKRQADIVEMLARERTRMAGTRSQGSLYANPVKHRSQWR